jgi:hypothetical protein
MLVTEGQSRRIQVRAADPNGDALTYSWTVDGRAVTNNQSSFEFGTINRTVGNHRVGVMVRDIDGLTANCEFRVTIDPRPNTAPRVALTLDKTDVYAGDTVGASAQASDPENDPITYAWTLDSQRRPESSSRIQINTRGLAGGRHSVAVTVEDDRGASANDTKTFSVSEKIVIRMEGNLPNNVAKAQLDEIALKMRQNPQLRATLTARAGLKPRVPARPNPLPITRLLRARAITAGLRLSCLCPSLEVFIWGQSALCPHFLPHLPATQYPREQAQLVFL